jgi:hypothetical protein
MQNRDENRSIDSKIKGLREYKSYLIKRINEEKENKISQQYYKREKRNIDKQIKHLLSLKDNN